MEHIGSIVALDGRVTAVDDTGRARVLRPGDPVHSEETLITALGATVTVRLSGGADLCLEPGRLMVLDADVTGDVDGVDDGAVRMADLELVLAWPRQQARSSAA